MTNLQAYDLSEQLSRTEMLLGTPAMQKLAAARVAVFGIGGVGGHTVEALARSGIGALDLIDSDRVSLSNLNRQIIATRQTIGMLKVEAARERIMQINPEIKVTCYPVFFLPENAADFDFTAYDYVVDAVDTVTAKIALIMQARQAGTPVISCMGAGNKLDPSRFEVADIYQTTVCPLAKVMRRELKKRGVDTLKVVYSREEAQKPTATVDAETGKHPPASCAFVPAVAGLIMAGEVIKDIAAE
ncbi:MAG: tRNA threonylcarbamoyladenosine dehydratase [Firmicutes bacterium]|nr:tRNA threonylcarbamoyladenosine dehydratase [Bacillota bacterium]